MTIFGVTGHQDLPVAARDFARSRITRLLRDTAGSDLRGVTSLAVGADQLFAQIIVELHGTLEVVVPAADYETTFTDAKAKTRFQALLQRAAIVDRLGFACSSEEAFWAAGQAVADRSDVLLAVWDGRPSRGLGGTADVVDYARRRGIVVRVVWPPDTER